MQSILAPNRLMPDPIPWRGWKLYPGVLTACEHAAIIRVLRAIESRPCATVTFTWSGDDLDAYIALCHAGYARTVPAVFPEKATAPTRWDRIELTAEGEIYLRQAEHP